MTRAIVAVALSPVMLRSGLPMWMRILRLLAILPFATLALRLAVTGGLSFWS